MTRFGYPDIKSLLRKGGNSSQDFESARWTNSATISRPPRMSSNRSTLRMQKQAVIPRSPNRWNNE